MVTDKTAGVWFHWLHPEIWRLFACARCASPFAISPPASVEFLLFRVPEKSKLEEKYGPAGTYGDVNVFKRPYLSETMAQSYLQNASHSSDQAVAYAKQICSYIFDTYGRFPARCDAFHVPGIWLQFSHLELEYYEKFYAPHQFARQREHGSLWGESADEPES